jgi:hypothetical protein
MMRGLSYCKSPKTLREEQLGEKIAWIDDDDDDDDGDDDDGIGVDGEWSKAGGRSSLSPVVVDANSILPFN